MPVHSRFSGQLYLRALIAALVVTAGCAGHPQAPSCDAETTQSKAGGATMGILAKAEGGEMFQIGDTWMVQTPGRMETITEVGSRASLKGHDRELVSHLSNIRTVDRNRDVGSWTCAADVQIIAFEGHADIPVLPITYTSEIADGDQHYVAVQVHGDRVRWPGGRPGLH